MLVLEKHGKSPHEFEQWPPGEAVKDAARFRPQAFGLAVDLNSLTWIFDEQRHIAVC
ncbi:MAG: hypothetical protein M5U12_32735 [Verrucomicrobia bacterium]|nr:hypothetical protein [Verrucomicrobiota bacterium]